MKAGTTAALKSRHLEVLQEGRVTIVRHGHGYGMSVCAPGDKPVRVTGLRIAGRRAKRACLLGVRLLPVLVMPFVRNALYPKYVPSGLDARFESDGMHALLEFEEDHPEGFTVIMERGAGKPAAIAQSLAEKWIAKKRKELEKETKVVITLTLDGDAAPDELTVCGVKYIRADQGGSR